MSASSWRSRIMGSALVAVAVILAACGPAAQSPTAVENSAPQQQSQLKLNAAGFTLVDPSKFPEPPDGGVGWIPPADLTATPKHGGTVRFNGCFTRLDPHFPINACDQRRLMSMYGNGLLKWDIKTNSPTLDLAQSWEESPDRLTYTFKLHQGIKFHNRPPVNGRELTADDVKWNLDRLSGASRVPGQASFNYERFATVKEVEVVDKYTVRIKLKQPDNMMFRELMYEYSPMLAKEAAINGLFSEAKTLIGTGAFMVDLADPNGLARLVRNPDYWDKGPQNKPYLDSAEQQLIAPEALPAAFKTKQMDMVIGGWSAFKPIINDGALKGQFRLYHTRGNMVGYSGVSMNPNVKPFDDIRVRRAVHLAIDRDEMLDLNFDGPNGGYMNSFLGGYWQPWFWTEDKLRSLPGWRKEKDQDVAEAKKLLAEAGYTSGLTITCECENAAQGETLRQQMERVGITLKLNIQSGNVIRHTTYMKDKQMSSTTQGGLHTPDGSITQSFLCSSEKNMAAWCDEKFDQMWLDFRKEFDGEKAVTKLNDLQQHLLDVMVNAPTIRNTSYHLGWNYVRGWRNQFYDCCAAHGNQWVDVWVDK